MNICARSVLMAGVATVTASAVAIAPSVQPPPPPRPTIQLAADVQLLAQPPAPTTLSGWVQRIVIPPNFGTPPPPPPQSVVPTPGSIGSSITGIYNAVEPWAHYVAELAQYVVGWIPYVGWLAPQIDIFYHLGERIVHSIVFNIADWLDGNISFGQGLVNVGVDTINSFIFFANDQLAFWLPNIPLPPLPGIFTPQQATTLMGPTEAPGVGVANAGSLQALLDRVLNNPLNADGDVDAAFKGGAALGSLVRNGIAGIGDLFGVPLSPPVTAPTGELERTSDIGTVPSMVKTPFAQFNSAFNSVPTRIDTEADVDQTSPGPLTEVTKTVRNVRNEIRANFNFNAATERRTEGAATNGVVRAQGEVRGVVARAVNDVVDAVRAGRPGKVTDEVAKAPTTVAKSFRDTAKKVVNDVRQAAKDFRDAAKDRAAADDE